MGRRSAGPTRLVLLALTAILIASGLVLLSASAQPVPPGAQRDPFAPLVTKPKPESGGGKKEELPLTKIKLVGIVWDRERTRAMVETPDGLGYVLKENDKIFGGKVVAIQRDRIRFLVEESGAGEKPRPKTVEIKLHPGE